MKLKVPSDDSLRIIFSNLSPAERIKACKISNMAIKGMWPLLGRNPSRQKSNGSIMQYYDYSNIDLLKAYIRETKEDFELPKYILLTDQLGYTCFIGTNMTKYTQSHLRRNKLTCTETPTAFIISKLRSNQSQTAGRHSSHLNLRDVSNVLNSSHSSHCSADISNSSNNQQEEFNLSALSNLSPLSQRILNDLEAYEESDDSSEEFNNENIDFQSDDEECKSELSQKTQNRHKLGWRNIFKRPENLSNEDIQNLCHCSKEQFLDCVREVEDYLPKTKKMSKYSMTFLFRLKVSFFLSLYQSTSLSVSE